MTQPCKICRGTGNVECPNQLCTHWCPCTVCDGTGKVEIVEDWSKGHLEEKVRAEKVNPEGMEYVVQVLGENGWSDLGLFARGEFAEQYKTNRELMHPDRHYRIVERLDEPHPELLEVDKK